ncbi:MAG: UDP-glucose 6-dehydrogenase [Bdellovibrionales bacterium RIFOXYB1_FULL_37_110]|nr:MAG: UDP-glucose 6-dehydrogenase [Bdellovibrionales bacterium RIFOXYA1_FULL_38_20]OFZ48479.1 MAG: UDP-glucose 6-dehydrogenase [Bdellovibrionales bacterium RIFOXYC1_FULL_37_79]OFZ58000.1 MAG: UDP-glucose 6-dehydrogenase [Bdellovibrionales bacterium RIFOXYB1_FULL_37_110]OFZ63137.1 MAG: UDP-glucose 6-dehydrogenase [Bdellovibrionales bacterium RIFOXYD1_FULL_36_51]
MKVTVIGTGYVGLVSGVCFAEIGHHVTCVDIDPQIISKLNNGHIHIYEPGLKDLLDRNFKAERINFSTNYDSIKDSKVVFIAVGTPSKMDGRANLDYVKDSAISIAKNLNDGTIVVLKSTVPVGTHKWVKEVISENTKKKFYLVNNPEFLKEGSAVDDFMRPDRVVVGIKEPEAGEIMKELYSPLTRQGNPIILMSNASAEVTKYASNAFLATKITFINEIAKFCDATGADVEEVRQGMTTDSRIGKQFLFPGPGYGGSCFPKDVRAIIHTSEDLGIELRIPRAVNEVNEIHKLYLFEKIKKHFGENLSGKTFALWGVAFKPNTDDVREAPAIKLASELIKYGACIHYFDPEAMDNFQKFMDQTKANKGKLTAHNNKYDCLNGADALVVMTEWGEFRVPDFMEIKSRLKMPVIFDGRNLYRTDKVLDLGFKYYAIGKYVEGNH